MEKKTLYTGNCTKKDIENARELVKMAGGVKFVAAQCGLSTDNFHNPLRGMSSDFTTVEKMVKKAKLIVAKKIKELA